MSSAGDSLLRPGHTATHEGGGSTLYVILSMLGDRSQLRGTNRKGPRVQFWCKTSKLTRVLDR